MSAPVPVPVPVPTPAPTAPTAEQRIKRVRRYLSARAKMLRRVPDADTIAMFRTAKGSDRTLHASDVEFLVQQHAIYTDLLSAARAGRESARAEASAERHARHQAAAQHEALQKEASKLRARNQNQASIIEARSKELEWYKTKLRAAVQQTTGIEKISATRAYQLRKYSDIPDSANRRIDLKNAAIALLLDDQDFYLFGPRSWRGIISNGGRTNQLAHAGACIAALIDLMSRTGPNNPPPDPYGNVPNE